MTRNESHQNWKYRNGDGRDPRISASDAANDAVSASRLFHWRSRCSSNAFGPTIAHSDAITTSGIASVGAGHELARGGHEHASEHRHRHAHRRRAEEDPAHDGQQEHRQLPECRRQPVPVTRRTGDTSAAATP